MLSKNTSQNKAATYIGRLDLKSVHDTAERYNITNLAVLSNDRLLALDATNSTVKLFYTSPEKYLSELSLYDPRDIAATIKDQVAVTSCFAKKIFILKVTDAITNEREICVNGPCSGIAYSNNRLVVMVEQKNGVCRLEIFDLNGNLIKRIRPTASTDGAPLFKYPEHLCISQDGEAIMAGDVSRNEIISFTFKGRLISRQASLNPQQMSPDSRGNLYICGGAYRGYKNVLARLASDGRLDALFLTEKDGLEFITKSVAYCQSSDRLFVGAYSDCVVQIYQLSSV